MANVSRNNHIINNIFTKYIWGKIKQMTRLLGAQFKKQPFVK